MCNPVRQVPAPATCKDGGWSRHQRPFRPPRPVSAAESRPCTLSLRCESAGLARALLAQRLSPLTSRLSAAATPPAPPALRATRSAPRAARSAAIAVDLAAPYIARQRLVLASTRRRLTMLNLVKVARHASGLPSVKIAHRELLKCAAHRRHCRLSSDPPPPLIRLRSAWRFRGLSISSPPNFLILSVMSKSNMLLGLAKGKVGDLVFYRDGGEQRTRTRVIPKNPRTPAQMTQRAKIANVSGIYRALASLMADSFTNRPSNQSGYNAFASSAIALSPFMTKQQATAACVLPQPAILSRGILPSIEYTGVAGVADAATAIALAGEFTGTSTIAQVSAALIAQYPGIQQGDELTFVSLRFDAIEGADVDADVYAAIPSIVNFKVDIADDTTLSAAGLSFATGTLAAAGAVSDWEDGIAMQAIMHSRVDGNGQLQLSTQWARLSEAAQSLYDGYRTEQAIADAVESYMAGSESILR